MGFDIHHPDLDVRSCRLLEASAGTGKTYSIGHLFIRLILSDPLIPFDRMALITFTKKATQSLKIRLKQNLELAIHQIIENDVQWPYLQKAIEKKSRDLVLKRLLEAALHFDQIRISTIHSFAATLLQRLGWESTNDSVKNENDEYLKKLIRLQLQSLDKNSLQQWRLLELIEQAYQSKTDKLVDDLAQALKSGLEIGLDEDLSCDLDAALKLLAKEESASIVDWIKEDYLLFKGVSNRSKELHYFIHKAAESWNQCVKQKKLLEINSVIDLIESFQPDLLNKHSKVDKNRLSDYFSNWKPYLPLLRKMQAKAQVLEKLSSYLKRRLSTILQEDERIGQNIVLQKLANRIEHPIHAKALAQSLDVLIVDEFQDTDPLQWKILSQLRQYHAHLTLILVGDPKQSIYAFRHADIYSYLQARSFIEKQGGKIELLDTNYRSHPDLIDALNHLFNSERIPDWMRLPRTSERITCHPIHAGLKAPSNPHAPSIARLQFFQLEKSSKSELFANQAKLIESSYFLLKNQGMKTFAALVSTRNEASSLELALKPLNIPCQLQRPIPFCDLESTHIYHMVLSAYLNPKDEVAMKSLFYLPCWGYQIKELDHYFSVDQTHYHYFWSQVQHLQNLLIHKGLGAFHEAWLSSYLIDQTKTIQEQLESSDQGKQIVEHWRALVTWMHQYQATLAGAESKLLLTEILQGAYKDTAVYRSKIEEESIQILTIHACKGLEYDVVYSFGTASTSQEARKKWYPSFVGNHLRLLPYDGSDHLPHYQAACDELDAEKARKLYVAWTRAKQYLFITLPPKVNRNKLARGSASPLELLMATWQLPYEPYVSLYEVIKEGSYETFHQQISFLVDKGWGGRWQLEENTTYTKNSPEPVKIGYKPFTPTLIDLSKRLSYIPLRSLQESFSSLSSKIELPSLEPKEFKPTSGELATDEWGLLPKGKEVGILWHEVIQRAIQFSKFKKNPDVISHQLTGWFEQKLGVLEPWHLSLIKNACELLSCKWQVEDFSFRLLELPSQSIRTEKKFILSKSQAHEIISQAYPRQAVNPQTLFQIQGVIDTWILYEGHSIFFDWKSNWLGPDASCYSSQAMIDNALEHRYDLQARIYQKAISAYLQAHESIRFESGIYVYLRALEAIHWDQRKEQFKSMSPQTLKTSELGL